VNSADRDIEGRAIRCAPRFYLALYKPPDVPGLADERRPDRVVRSHRGTARCDPVT